MANTKYSGTDLQIWFAGTEISGNGASLEVDEGSSPSEVTSFGDNDEEYARSKVVGRKATYQGFDGTAETIYDACPPDTEGTLVWDPQGSTAGLVRKTVLAITSNRRRAFRVKDAVALNVEFQLSGAVTDGTVP